MPSAVHNTSSSRCVPARALQDLDDGAVVRRIGRPVRTRVVHQRVHVPSEQILDALVSERAETRRIAERAAALDVDAVDGLGRRVENQPELVFALADGVYARLLECEPLPFAFHALALGDDGGQRQAGHRQHREEHVQQHRVDERRVLREGSGAERRLDRRDGGDEQRGDACADDAEPDRRPHDERQHRKRQDVQPDRDERQVAEDDEARRREQRQEQTELREPEATAARLLCRYRHDERRDQQHARGVAQQVDQPGGADAGVGLRAGGVEH